MGVLWVGDGCGVGGGRSFMVRFVFRVCQNDIRDLARSCCFVVSLRESKEIFMVKKLSIYLWLLTCLYHAELLFCCQSAKKQRDFYG